MLLLLGNVYRNYHEKYRNKKLLLTFGSDGSLDCDCAPDEPDDADDGFRPKKSNSLDSFDDDDDADGGFRPKKSSSLLVAELERDITLRNKRKPSKLKKTVKHNAK